MEMGNALFPAHARRLHQELSQDIQLSALISNLPFLWISAVIVYTEMHSSKYQEERGTCGNSLLKMFCHLHAS